MLDPQVGKFTSSFKKVKLVLHGFAASQKVKINGKAHACQAASNSYFLPLEKFDPIADPPSMGKEDVLVTTFDYSTEQIVIEW